MFEVTDYSDPTPYSQSDIIVQARALFPPGLVGDFATYIHISAPYPNFDIALAGAIAMMAGICGQRYNTPTGAGLNQYIIVAAETGRGKEAIAEGTGKLLAAAQGNVIAGEPGAPCVGQFKLPSHFASVEGLIKQLAKTPCGFSIQGEFGIKLKQMMADKAPAVLQSLRAGLLDIHGKSGDGKIVDPMVYSDAAKNTPPIPSVSLTIIGETTFVELFEGFNQRAITSGFLPRFMFFRSEAARPYLNPNVGMAPWPELVEAIRSLAATCANYAKDRQAVRVEWDSQAQASFAECERSATDYVNANRSIAHAELWNRAYIKALKLASLMAVGINPHFPRITLEIAKWAINLIAEQTNWLACKFDNGEVGEEAGNEQKQYKKIISIISDYLGHTFNPATADRQTADMHTCQIFTHNFVLRRCHSLPAFKPRPGDAVKRVINELLDADLIRPVDLTTMDSKFGTKAKGYMIHSHKTFDLRGMFFTND